MATEFCVIYSPLHMYVCMYFYNATLYIVFNFETETRK